MQQHDRSEWAEEALALAKLRAHEQELDIRLSEARVAAQEILARAAEKAAALIEQAERDLTTQLAHVREEKDREREAVVERTRHAVAERVQAIARAAAEHKEEILAKLLNLIAGGPGP